MNVVIRGYCIGAVDLGWYDPLDGRLGWSNRSVYSSVIDLTNWPKEEDLTLCWKGR